MDAKQRRKLQTFMNNIKRQAAQVNITLSSGKDRLDDTNIEVTKLNELLVNYAEFVAANHPFRIYKET